MVRRSWTPERRARQTEWCRQTWGDPRIRQARVEARNKSYAHNPNRAAERRRYGRAAARALHTEHREVYLAGQKRSSITMKQMWQDPAYRAKQLKGQMKAIEQPGYREKLSRAAKRRGFSPEHLRNLRAGRRKWVEENGAPCGWKLSEETRANHAAARARLTFPFNNTSIEKIVRRYLFSLGLRPVKQFRPDWLRTHAFDVALPGLKLLVEADGCYWHGCRLCGRKDMNKARARDRRFNEIVLQNGWRIVRLWEHDIQSGEFKKILGLVFRDLTAAEA